MVLEHGEITEQIVGAAFEVHSVLGYGLWRGSISGRCRSS